LEQWQAMSGQNAAAEESKPTRTNRVTPIREEDASFDIDEDDGEEYDDGDVIDVDSEESEEEEDEDAYDVDSDEDPQ
ncbi:MAG: hypothetical protein ACREHD_09055, partial [Pirellulales bacterium]